MWGVGVRFLLHHLRPRDSVADLSVCGLGWHFVWTSNESHFLFTSTWTHPWSFSFAIQQPPFTSRMRAGSRVASTSGLACDARNVLCPHLAKPWHLSCGVGAGFFQKALSWNQESKYSPSTVAARSLWSRRRSDAVENTVLLFVFACWGARFVGFAPWDNTLIQGCLDKHRKVLGRMFITLFCDNLTDYLNWPDVAKPHAATWFSTNVQINRGLC